MKKIKNILIALALLLTVAGCSTLSTSPDRAKSDVEYRENPHAMRIIFYTFGASKGEVISKAEALMSSVGVSTLIDYHVEHKDGIYWGRFVVQYDMDKVHIDKLQDSPPLPSPEKPKSFD